MSTTTTIEWADRTWGPVLGCDKVSPGCDSCYAITTAHIRAGHPNEKISSAFAGLTHRTDTGLDWTGVIRTLPGRLADPLRWRAPQKVFVNSMSDLFHSDLPTEFIAQVWAVMALAGRHTFQVLTKRHGRMRALLNSPDFREAVAEHATDLIGSRAWRRWQLDLGGERLAGDSGYGAGWTTSTTPAGTLWSPPWPLPNVWVGVSVEDQKTADLRIPVLLETNVAVPWISLEPLLGPVNLHPHWLAGRPAWGPDEVSPTGLVTQPLMIGPSIGWVVVGGESGPKARPMHPEWARGIRDQVVAAGVPLLFKQWGEWGPAPWSVPVCDPAVGWHGTADELKAAKAASEAAGATHAYAVWAHLYRHELYKPSHRPWSVERTALDGNEHAPMRRWGKKAAGNELDGKVWDEYPATVTAGAGR